MYSLIMFIIKYQSLKKYNILYYTILLKCKNILERIIFIGI